MKKTVYLLVALCIGGVGFVQAAPTYDYDRLPTSQDRNVYCSSDYHQPGLLATITATLEEQTVAVPQRTYGRISLAKTQVDVGDMILQLKVIAGENGSPAKLRVSKTDKEDMDVDVQYWASYPIQLKTEYTDGETVVEQNGTKEYTCFSAIKLEWQDPNGELHNEFIGKVY